MTVYTKDVNQFTHEDAIELAYMIERQEQAMKLMKDKLQAFVKLNGAVETQEKVWDFVPATKWVFESTNLQNMAADIALTGKNPFDFFSFGANDRKKLGWSDADLLKYGSQQAANPTFKGVKKK